MRTIWVLALLHISTFATGQEILRLNAAPTMFFGGLVWHHHPAIKGGNRMEMLFRTQNVVHAQLLFKQKWYVNYQLAGHHKYAFDHETIGPHNAGEVIRTKGGRAYFFEHLVDVGFCHFLNENISLQMGLIGSVIRTPKNLYWHSYKFANEINLQRRQTIFGSEVAYHEVDTLTHSLYRIRRNNIWNFGIETGINLYYKRCCFNWSAGLLHAGNVWYGRSEFVYTSEGLQSRNLHLHRERMNKPYLVLRFRFYYTIFKYEKQA